MNKKLLIIMFTVFFLCSIAVIPQISYCQTATSSPTEEPQQEGSLDLLLIGGIAAAVVVVVVVVVAFIILKKRTVNEKTLKRFSSTDFQDWVIKKFNGKPSDPSSGITGFTEGGQPLLIKQSDVSLAEVDGFVKALSKGHAQKGTIVAFNFDADTIEGKVTAMDNGIELQMLRINELVNKRFANRIKSIASSQATFEAVPFEAPPAYITDDRMTATTAPERISNEPLQNGGLKPRVFVSNSSTKVADQVKKMLEFLHYDYVMGDREETAVPISESKFGLMKGCDCAIINIAAAEQERRYSGLYILNSNVNSEINAAYLKYNTQVVLLVERKVDLPPNLKGLKRVEYDSDDLSFNAAMDLEKVLADFRKM